ncbi:hypothetical protein ES705_45579 [subsurface metagenome]
MSVDTEVKVEANAVVEKPPAVCFFKGYLRDDGTIVIKADSEECREAIVAAGIEMGVDVELEKPAVECEPCKEAAKSFLARMRALRAVRAEPAEPVIES